MTYNQDGVAARGASATRHGAQTLEPPARVTVPETVRRPTRGRTQEQ